MKIYLRDNGEWKLFDNPTQEDFDKRKITICEGADIREEAYICEGAVIGDRADIREEAYIGEGAYIRERAVIGEGAYIREGAVICARATIGARATICERATIGARATICDRAVICEEAYICEGAVIRERAVIGEGAYIRERAVIGERAVIREGHEGLVLIGGYRYTAGCYFDSNTQQIIIRLGCHHRTLSEWDDEFDNNPYEFPTGSPQWEARKETYEMLKAWALKHYREEAKDEVR